MVQFLFLPLYFCLCVCSCSSRPSSALPAMLSPRPEWPPQWPRVLLNLSLLLLTKARPFLVRMRDRKPCLRLRTRWLGSKVSLFGPLDWSSPEPRPLLALAPGASRVVASERDEVVDWGRVGRVWVRKVESGLLKEVRVLRWWGCVLASCGCFWLAQSSEE